MAGHSAFYLFSFLFGVLKNTQKPLPSVPVLEYRLAVGLDHLAVAGKRRVTLPNVVPQLIEQHRKSRILSEINNQQGLLKLVLPIVNLLHVLGVAVLD